MLRLLNKRRLRVNPRVIKRKMSRWAVKRACHRNPARPNAPPRDTIVITGPSRTASQKRQPRVPPTPAPQLSGIASNAAFWHDEPRPPEPRTRSRR